MKRFYKLISFLMVTVVISACGASTTPTPNPVDVQNTAAAVAFTGVAETQAALPTATSTALPTATITQTLAPTETSTETPTLEATFTATATVATGGNSECNKPLQGLSGGKPAKIKIENNSGFPVTVSLFLNKNAFGDCGYRGYTLIKGGSVLITDLIQGCYSASAIINNPKKPVSAFGYGCINNPDKWSFIVLKDSVSLQGR
jgi:hypothetical protein